MSGAAAIAAIAHAALLLEVATWPKPGLVSRLDCGSHADMDAARFHRSADAILPFLAALADAGGRRASMNGLRAIGTAAEAAMHEATGGANTHRGAIWGLGLLCAAAGRLAADGGGQAGITAKTLGDTVVGQWGDGILQGAKQPHSHGAAAQRNFGAGGARLEAAQGFPSLSGVGLPALRLGRQLAPDDPEAARVQCCFALIAAVEDTNLRQRGGAAGAGFARGLAQRFIEAGGVGQPGWRQRATAVHRRFVARGLSPGGSADLLAMTLFVESLGSGVRAP